MKTLNFRTEIGPDGKLRVELPVDVPPGPVDGVIVLHPVARVGPPYDTLKGALAGTNLSDIDVEADVRDIRSGWQAELDGEE